MSKAKRQADCPEWPTIEQALRAFAGCKEKTQSQKHIRPLHWYTACRLVIEGGFRPEYITPRPPFRVSRTPAGDVLEHDPSAAVPGEHTVFGGLKTKDVDVVVAIPGIGPVLAISMKGTLNAFRNLTNRMEEAAGDCTNIHMAYPGLVYAFWHVFRGNKEGLAPDDTPATFELEDGRFKPADIAVRADGSLSNHLVRYLMAMERLNGRPDMRDEPSSYEAIGITLVDTANGCSGAPLQEHPRASSRLRYEQMFDSLYRIYDLRFVYQAPALKDQTRRLVWMESSPALSGAVPVDYESRIGDRGDEESDAV